MGCAIVSRQRILSEYIPDESTPWLKELRGCVVVAKLRRDDPLWIASIHSDAYPVQLSRLTAFPTDGLLRCDQAGVWEIELVAMELERLVGDQRFIAGGDLNSALLFDTTYDRQNNARLFSNLRQIGFYDLRTTEHEQQTFFRNGTGPYQLDHIYGDAVTASVSHTWRVIAEPARDLQLSDHAPIEVILD